MGLVLGLGIISYKGLYGFRVPSGEGSVLRIEALGLGVWDL